MYKVGLVGVGGITGAHIPAWNNMEDTDLVAMCDIRPEMMEQYDGVRKYTDFDEMLAKEELDILDICLPTNLHVDYAIKAMDKGIHVICEKPISLHKEDVARAYAAAERNNVRFMIAQVVRFMPNYALIKELHDSKKYGKLLSGTMNRLGCYPGWSWDNWMRDETRSGLVPYDLHVHDCDFMVYAFGKPNKQTSFRSKLPEQDYLHVVYEYDDFFIEGSASWYAAPYPFTASFRFQFEKAMVSFDGVKLMVYEVDGDILDLSEQSSQEDMGNDNVPKSDGYALEIRYFTDCVTAGVAPSKVKPQELETVIDLLNNI